jgi:hypothetical protein
VLPTLITGKLCLGMARMPLEARGLNNWSSSRCSRDISPHKSPLVLIMLCSPSIEVV